MKSDHRVLRSARITVSLALGGCASLHGHVVFQPAPIAGLHSSYRYVATERVPGQPVTGYRLDFDLLARRDGSLVAVVRVAERRVSDTWTPAQISADCARALHAENGELARVTLQPLSAEAAASLGEAFMASCAPAELFFPMTDILNVAIVQTSAKFKIRQLHRAGDNASFSGFATQFDRLGTAVKAVSAGGRIRLVSLEKTSAIVSWTPEPMDLQITHHGEANPFTMVGQEHYAFRLEIDPLTGELVHASTVEDYLDVVLSMPGASPKSGPRLRIDRDVSIERLGRGS